MQTGVTPSSNWPEWGALGVAILALVQPWVMALWNRFVRRGVVEVYEGGNLEVAFSGFGPTMALVGTLRAIHQHVFVRNMTLTVVRQKDKAHLDLSWRAFRPNAIPLNSDAPHSLEVASGFLLTTSGPHKYNVFFVSDQYIAEHQPAANRLTEAWKTFARTKRAQVDPAEPITADLANPVIARLWVDEFMARPEPTALRDALNHTFFWLPGNYDLTLNVESARPVQLFERRWTFSVSEEESLQLRSNIIALIEGLCGLDSDFQFVYPEYERPA